MIYEIVFFRVIRDISREIGGEHIKWRRDALEAIHCGSESFLVKLMENGNLAAIHAGRVTIQVKDIQLVMRLLDIKAAYKTDSAVTGRRTEKDKEVTDEDWKKQLGKLKEMKRKGTKRIYSDSESESESENVLKRKKKEESTSGESSNSGSGKEGTKGGKSGKSSKVKSSAKKDESSNEKMKNPRKKRSKDTPDGSSMGKKSTKKRGKGSKSESENMDSGEKDTIPGTIQPGTSQLESGESVSQSRREKKVKRQKSEQIVHIGGNDIPPLACGMCRERFYTPRGLMTHIVNAHERKSSRGNGEEEGGGNGEEEGGGNGEEEGGGKW